MIKRIKANYAEIKDDLVIIRRTSFRISRLLQGAIVGLILSMAMDLITAGIGAFAFTSIIVFCSAVGFFSPRTEEIYTLPKKDLIIIKNYPHRRKVTVIFDDEKSKLKLFE